MHVHLIAPFRTLLNMHTECALATSEACRAMFHRVSREISQAGAAEIAVPTAVSSNGFTKFSTLEIDSDTQYAMPLFTARFVGLEDLAAGRDALANAHAALRACGAVEIRAEIVGATAHLFDNTIGIAHIVVDISPQSGAVNADALDRFTSALASHFIDAAMQPIAASLIRRLQKEPPYSRQNGNVRTITKRKNEFVVFSDISTQTFPDWDPKRPSMLWCNRTIDLTGAREADAQQAAMWARIDDGSEAAPADEAIKAGINVLRGRAVVDEFISAMIKMQYFYTLLDVLNDIQRSLYFTVTSESTGAGLDVFARRSRAALGVLELALTEFDDFMIGLQHRRKRYCEALSEEFDLQRLVRNVKSRTATVSEKVARLVQARSERRQRFLQGGVVVIGSFQILSFALDASVDAKNFPAIVNDKTPGLLHLVDHLPVDVTLNGIVLVALVVAVFYTHWRRI
jgi:hypothetical protein